MPDFRPPTDLFDNLVRRVNARLQPPAWVVHGVQHRTVLFINHVLGQESEAQSRLARQAGRVVLFQWRSIRLKLVATPAGLVDLAAEHAPAELTLAVAEASPLALVRGTLRGEKPAVRIVGDVQLARPKSIGWSITCAGTSRTTWRVSSATFRRVPWARPGAVSATPCASSSARAMLPRIPPPTSAATPATAPPSAPPVTGGHPGAR